MLDDVLGGYALLLVSDVQEFIQVFVELSMRVFEVFFAHTFEVFD